MKIKTLIIFHNETYTGDYDDDDGYDDYDGDNGDGPV